MAESTVQKIVTPKGELEWVVITGEGKPNMSGKLQYTANLVLDPKNIEEHQKVLDEIQEFWDKNKPSSFKGKPKSLGFYLHDPILDENGEPVVDDEDKKVYNPDGRVYLAFKTGTSYKDGKQKVIKTFNAKAKRVELGETKIGNGSIGQISGAMGIYVNKEPTKGKILDAGVTLYLDAIKITKLVEYQGSDGFEADEELDDDAFTGEDDTFEGTETTSAGPRL